MKKKYEITGPTPELPATVQAWKDARKDVRKMSVNDGIEAGHLALVKDRNGAYLDLLKGRKNDETVHGSIVIDQTKAAEMVKEKVGQMGLVVLNGINLARVYKGLNSMLSHRYPQFSREKLRKDSRRLIEQVQIEQVIVTPPPTAAE